MKTRIDFFIVGAEKSGTTSLHRYLGQHPQVFTPFEKELAYFDRDPNPALDAMIDKYYAAARCNQVIGLSHVNSLLLPGTAERIYGYNPAAKILVILRNPVERAYSAYWFKCIRGWESRGSVEQAIQSEMDGISISQITEPSFRRSHTYLIRGHYAEQLQRYLDVLSEDQVKVLLKEDLELHPKQTMAGVFQWLGVAPEVDGVAFREHYNVTSRPRFPRLTSGFLAISAPARWMLRGVSSDGFRRWLQRAVIRPLAMRSRVPFSPPPMATSTRQLLHDYFRPHNQRLEQLLGRDLAHWR
ncbi:MAG: sulfotransferase [Planctomycetota bacterium]|nr:sulfotransferase [Planctomycetota bacterium]